MAENLKGHLLVFYSQIWKLDSLNVPQQTALNSKWKGICQSPELYIHLSKASQLWEDIFNIDFVSSGHSCLLQESGFEKQKRTVADKLV